MIRPEGRRPDEQLWTCSECGTIGVCAPVDGSPACRECRAELLEVDPT